MLTTHMRELLNLYGDRTYFLQALQENYDEIAFISGPYVNEVSIVGGFILRKKKYPSANTLVVYHPKNWHGGLASRASAQKDSLSPLNYKIFKKNHRLKVNRWFSLCELLNDWIAERQPSGVFSKAMQ